MRAQCHFINGKFAKKRVILPAVAAIALLSFTSSGVSQASAQQDQQALTILAQTIAAAGGSNLISSIQDVSESGTVTYYLPDPISGTVTVKSRGLGQLRVDADLPDGERSTLLNGADGSLKETNGLIRPIHHQSSSDLQSLTLPYVPLIAVIQDSSSSITYAGVVTHNGAPAYDIRIQKIYTQRQDPTRTRGMREARDIYIATNTFLVLAISDQIYFGGPNDPGIPHEIVYSDYQFESGVAIPLTVTESVRGVPGSTMQFTQVTFNSGLTGSDFTW